MFKELVKILHYQEMLKNTVRKDLRVRYKGSVLGFLWTFLNPLLQLIVYSVVFKNILRVAIDPNVNYTAWLFVALVPWTCISASILQSTTLIVQNGNLIKKIYFPRLILPLSMTLTNFVNFLLTQVIVILALIFFKAPFHWVYVFLPLVFLAVFALCLSLSILLSALTVFFRDLEHIFSIVIMMWFYLSPIIYDDKLQFQNSNISNTALRLYKLNPIYGIVKGIRAIMIEGKVPNFKYLGYSFLFSGILFLIALAVFDRFQRRFAEEI